MTPTIFVVVVLVVLVLVLGISLLLKRKGGTTSPGQYEAGQLMTENELEFFGRLVAALPQHYVFPQVAMSALLKPASGSTATRNRDRLRIAQQRIDYVICDRRCDVVAVVELDDRTHQRAKDQLRDRRVQQAGIRTLRFDSRAKPSADAIRSAILPAAAQATSPVEAGSRAQ